MAVVSWFRVLVRPSETFFDEGYDASLWGAVKNIGLALMVCMLVYGIILLALVFLMGVSLPLPLLISLEAGAGFITLLTFLPVLLIVFFIAFLIVVIVFFIESAILFVMSRILGGSGDFTTQTYNISLVEAAFILLSPFIEVLSLIPIISIIAGLYYLLLLTIALKEAHGYGILRAALSWLIPMALILVVLFFLISPLVSSIYNQLIDLGGYQTYRDSRYGFSINYPNGWIQNEESGVVYFEHPLEDAYLAVKIGEGVGGISPEEASELLGIATAYDSENVQYEVLSFQEVEVGGVRGYQVMIAASKLGVEGKVKETAIVKNGDAYVLAYIASVEVYPEYESRIDECVQSFRVGGVVSTTQPHATAVEIHQTISTPDFSYELYLPGDYSPDTPSPLIICLSPGGDGKDFRSSVYPVANERGYILVGSNDFANYRSFDYFLPRVYKTLDDVKSRFNIDEKRVYACGFSGGGMGAYVISYYKPDYFNGLIVNSGGIHEILYDVEKLRQSGVEKVVLLCGRGDGIVSCSHMKNDEKWLNAAGIETYLIEFDGGHTIAPVSVYGGAMDWLGG